MADRLVRRVLVASALAIAALLVAGAVMAAVDRGGRSAGDALSAWRPAVGVSVPDSPRVPVVRLVDAQGRDVSLSHWRGRWVVLAPAMTLCAEVCPMTTGALIRLESLLRRSGLSRRVVVIEATVDPWRDTSRRLRAYRQMTGARFPMLTGTPTAIRRLWRFFGVGYRRVAQGRPAAIDWLTHRPESFDVEHTDGLFIIGPSGRERVADVGMPDAAGRLPRALRALLDAQGHHNLAHPEQPWTPAEVLQDLRQLSAIHGVPHPPPAAAVARELRGSPPPLAALHHQAGRLLGSEPALVARLRKLRGRPVVVNAWASWCAECRAEAAVLASAAARFGRRVAFIGVDAEDSSRSAQAFLKAHPVSYPSYTARSRVVGPLGLLQGLPTTIFIDPAGKIVARHLGPYERDSSLDGDIARLLSPTRRAISRAGRREAPGGRRGDGGSPGWRRGARAAPARTCATCRARRAAAPA
jgi:cytochrome oxidase Cu insertion factor (SCO1/SenC/PrrC family)/thiol-disulfide isomerase/thioredoxin